MIDMTSTNRLRGRVVMRWLCCTQLILLCSFFAHAQLGGLTEKISVKLRNTTALKVLQELDRQSSYDFSYAQTQLERITIPAFSYENITLGKALEALGIQANLVYQVAGKVIAVKVSVPVAVPAATGVKPGRVTGVIRNEKNEVMPGVSITVQGVEKGITSSVSGDYVVSLPPGTYTLQVSFIGYTTKQITDVIVREGEVTDLSVVLDQADSRQLQTVVVTGGARRESVKALLMTQKNNASMTNGISAEQIRVTPDNNTGQVLKRVSGITVQNDKFVTIRGVSDRYNNVLINGASLPSTEPNRRNFSFDIVPSQLVDNIIVNKTATPDLPGEFTGGLVQITTKDVPVENFLSVTLGTGFNTASMNQDLVSYKRDNNAFLGKVDENRKYFGDGRVMDPVQYYHYRNDGNAAAINAVGAQIPNRWQFHRYAYQPQQNYQLTGGLNKRFNKSSLGFVAALTYLNEQLVEKGEAGIINQYQFDSERYRYNTTIGALFNTAFKTANHRISFKNLYNKRYSNQLDWRTGYYTSQGWDARRTGEVTLDSRLCQSRLEGEHKLTQGGLKADWFGDYIRMQRDQPDTRFITARQEAGADTEGKYSYNFSDLLLLLGGMYSSLLEEDRKNAGANISLPFNVLGEKQLIKAGYAWSQRKADFDAANFRIIGTAGYTLGLQGSPYYKIVVPEAFANGSLTYHPTSTRAESLGDRYTGTQTLQAGYVMLDLKPVKQLRLTGGLRYESNVMNLSTVYYDYNTALPFFSDSSYHEKDLLPSVNIIYSLTNKINLRLAFSKTLARPDFVERSPYVYYDFTELAEVIGQKGLQISRIDNYDVRFEYYPSGDEILSASFFHKDFSNPVERFYHIQTTSNRVEYQNLYKATATGFEIDIRKSLSFIDPGSQWLQRFYISGNYTHLEGEIKYIVTKSPVTEKDTNYIANEKRPIQGLSPYIVNAGLNYQSKTWGFNIGYNRIGRRIVNGGTIPFLIQWENPRDVVDLQLSTRLMKQKLELKVNLADILNQPVIIYSNSDSRDGASTPYGANNDPKGDGYNEELDRINYKVKKGANISMSLTWRL
jgi:TonB-dependent receptor